MKVILIPCPIALLKPIFLAIVPVELQILIFLAIVLLVQEIMQALPIYNKFKWYPPLNHNTSKF